MGYFWLPCPECGQCFGGHEWGFANGMYASINGKGICQDCADAGKSDTPQFVFNVTSDGSGK